MNLQTLALLATIVTGLVAIGTVFVALARFVRPRITRGRYRKDGTLLQRPGHPAVFVVIGGQRHAIPNEETFNEMGYDWGEIQLVPQNVIDGIPYGGELPGRTKGPNVADTPPSERPMRASSEAELGVIPQPQRIRRHAKVNLMVFGTRGGRLLREYECVVTAPNGTAWRCPLGEASSRDVLTFPDDFPGADTGTPGSYKVGLYVSAYEVVSTRDGSQPFFETSFDVGGEGPA